MSFLELKNISTSFCLKDVNLSVEKGEFLAIFGHSGAGKSTLLNILAGFIEHEGEVYLDGVLLNKLPTEKRGIGYLHQEIYLFPNMTVFENIAFGLRSKRIDFNLKDKVHEISKLVKVEHLLERYPKYLSGGEKQRVGLARTLVTSPKVLLLDEPLSSLDLNVRSILQYEIRQIHEKLGLTTIIVSHDIDEVLKLADRIALLETGRILRVGNPKEVLFRENMISKFQFNGYVVDIVKTDIVYLVFVNIGNSIVQVVASENDIKRYNIGDKVFVGTRSNNPIISNFSL